MHTSRVTRKILLFSVDLYHHIVLTVSFQLVRFYRAMHYSAKRGLAIACRLSVCLSVRVYVTLADCDRIGWNPSKIILRLISMRHSLSADANIMDLLQGEQPEIWAKVTHPYWFERWRHSITNCGRMVTESATVTMESLEETSIALLNGTIADPYDLPFHQMGVPYAHMIREWP